MEMKAKKINLTYINPAYEPGKSARTITETVAVVADGNDVKKILEARKFAFDVATSMGLRDGKFGIEVRPVVIF